MSTLYFDCESYSECDLRAHGTHRYAEHPSTCVIVAQWALDDDEPTVLDCSDDRDAAAQDEDITLLHSMLHDPAVTVVAHNSAFDRTVLRHCWGIDVPSDRWQDTMVKALAHGMPGGLDKIGAALGLPADALKDKRGKELIQLFCKPRPKNMKLRRATRETHPAEWAEFLAYSRQDIVSMRAIDRKLPAWNYRAGHPELALWHLDQRINDRGFAVDADLARAVVAATTARKADIRAEVHDATDGLVSGPSKRNDLLTFILAEHGVTLPDLKADTLRRRLDDPDLPDGVKLLLSLRLESNKASTAKYAALLKSASPDGRLRNTQQFCGAARTGRVAHRLFQPGNMPRPDMQAEDIDIGIEAMKAGCADLTHDVMRLGVNAVRGCIVAPPGRKLVVADLANIEGRGLVYLAGENWKLRAFAEYDAGTGPDLYCVAFGRSFGVEPTTVKGADRQIGKVQELALGYEGGVGAFLTFAAVYGMDLDKLADAVHRTAPRGVLAAAYRMHEWTEGKKISTYGLSQSVWVACEALKAMWRTAHPRTVSLWRAAHAQTALAILNPGVTFDIGEHVKARRDGNWLRLRLPSGRYLCYLAPKVTEDGSITYMGVNQYTRQWGRIKTYGGKLVENLTQAFARDVMFYNMPRIEAAGYNIVLTVHDEVLTETPDSSEYNSDALGALLATVPSWAEGIPLSAAGFETSRYRKD